MQIATEGVKAPSRTKLIGRDEEFTRLRDMADLAVEHSAQLVLVSGEAGIGKTTLTGEFVGQLMESGWGGHIGACIETADRPLPFGPIVSILRSILLGDIERLDEIVGHHRRDLSGLLPELSDIAEAAASLDGDIDRLFDAIAVILTEASRRRPNAILIEDIHWADAATRDLLSSLVNRLGTARTLLVITERTGATDRGHPLRTWIAEHRRLPNVHTIELEGLSRSELETQALRVLEQPPERRLIDELVERTRGNPYFSHELLVSRRDGSLALPVSLIDFLSSRISRLAPEERELMRALAIVGGIASHHMLRAMLPDLDVGRIVRSLCDASILEVDGSEFTFGHALLREVILSDVLPFEAEELHGRAAEAIIADPRQGHSLTDLTSLALHWGKAGDADRSITAAIQAGRAAAAVAAYEAAADMSLQAYWAWPAASAPDTDTNMSRYQLLLQTAEWLASCYRGEEAINIIREALAGWAGSLPPGSRALLLARLAPIHWHLGNPPETARVLAEAARLVGDEVSPEAAQVHHAISRQALADGQIHPALEAAERAVEIAEIEKLPVLLAEALSAKALGIGVTGDLDAGVALAQRARELALSEQLVSQTALTYHREMLMIVFQEGRTEACLEASRQGLAFAEQHCGPRWRAEIGLNLCLGLVEAGRLREAEPLFESLLSSELDDLRRLTVLQTSGLHALATGSYALADTFLTEAVEISDRYQSAQETGFQSRLQAELARRQGRLDEAIQLIDRALELQLAGDNLTYTRESIVEKVRIVRSRLEQDMADAKQQKAEVAILIDDFDGSGRANEAWHSLMRLELASISGPVELEAAHATIELVESAGYLYEAAQVRLLLIEQLMANGVTDRSTLETEIIELHGIADTHGITWIAEFVVSMAKVARVALELNEPPAPVPVASADAYPHHLTAREVEVMSLLAEGLTNKGIGERLFVSPRTVGTHISNLLAKLGVGNRGEAAAAYHRLGLAETIDLRDSEALID